MFLSACLTNNEKAEGTLSLTKRSLFTTDAAVVATLEVNDGSFLNTVEQPLMSEVVLEQLERSVERTLTINQGLDSLSGIPLIW